jgi:hypothetical protein
MEAATVRERLHIRLDILRSCDYGGTPIQPLPDGRGSDPGGRQWET